MKSITKKISFLILLSVTLILTSCLESNKSYIGNGEYSYISRDDKTGTIYARTISGYFITSERIKLLTPKTAAYLSYQINFDEAEKIMIGESNNVTIYSASLAGEPITIDQSILRLANAPDAPIVHFENIMTPMYSSDTYFGDLWLFKYNVRMKKGETVKIDFYKGDAENTTAGYEEEVIIDVRLTKSGEAEAGATNKIESYEVVVNMSEIRTMFVDTIKEQANLKFRFYRTANGDNIYTTTNAYTMLLK